MAGALSTLHQKTAVISGASAGIGRATALRLARGGAHVVLIARDAEALNEVKREIENCGGAATTFALDVADADAVIQASDSIARSRGSIDIWINNAMVTVFSPIW